MKNWSLRAARIVAEESDHLDGRIGIAGGRITDVSDGEATVDLGDATILPGLIDIHIHGREGRDVMDADPESLRIISSSLAMHGVTGFLATTVTADWDVTLSALSTVADMADASLPGARLMGAYSEGLFFSEAHKGAHNPDFFLEPTPERLAEMMAAARGWLKVIALAPERAGGLEAVRYIVANGMRAVIGHTDATYEQARAALECGASGGVHIFNGMRGIHHREPGCAGAMLLAPATVEVIADGVHLHDAILELIARTKSPGDILLISDCMCAGGLTDGQYRLGEMDVAVEDGVVRTPSGSLAGSTLTLDAAVARMARASGLDFRAAVHAASLAPARFLGIDADYGSIAPGKAADLAIFDGDRVRATIVGGSLVWCDSDWSRTADLRSILPIASCA